MHQLLNSNGEPLYSVQAIEKVLEKVTRPVPRDILFVPAEQQGTLTPADAFIATRRPDKLVPTDHRDDPFILECPALAGCCYKWL
jgi:hypothetical protein